MRKHAYSAFGCAMGLLLAACGSSDTPSFKTKGLIAPTAACTVDPRAVGQGDYLGDVNGPSACEVENAWRMHSVAGVRLKNGATMNCGVIGPLNDWLDGAVQPAAASAFGERVVAVDVAASYACRGRNNSRRARMSEHGFGNAIDISAFTLESGRRIAVKSGWRGSRGERAFLREVRGEACDDFKTVLGPGSDRHHRDHFHLDLANRRSGRHMCG